MIFQLYWPVLVAMRVSAQLNGAESCSLARVVDWSEKTHGSDNIIKAHSTAANHQIEFLTRSPDF